MTKTDLWNAYWTINDEPIPKFQFKDEVRISHDITPDSEILIITGVMQTSLGYWYSLSNPDGRIKGLSFPEKNLIPADNTYSDHLNHAV